MIHPPLFHPSSIRQEENKMWRAQYSGKQAQQPIGKAQDAQPISRPSPRIEFENRGVVGEGREIKYV